MCSSSPGGGRGGVAIALKGHQHGHALLLAQLQLAANLRDDGLTARVNAEVIESCFEVRRVRLHVHAQHLPAHAQAA
jgi:hypothetical protein